MSEIDRIRKEFLSRGQRLTGSDLYSLFNSAQLFTAQQRQRHILASLRRNGLYPLSERKILEVGCGEGGILIENLSYGASTNLLNGIDLLLDRLVIAKQIIATLPLTNSDGQNLPYAARCFDLTMQITAFSSILDEKVKVNVAHEMLRVTKPDGLILWYDFWLNPTNPQTRGIRPAEIKRLFPNCRYEFHRITLAPPLARRIVPISWILAYGLERLTIFNTHYLAAIRPMTDH